MEHILVGIDGSAESRAALAWAIGQAESKKASIRALMVVEDPTPNMWIPHGAADGRLKSARQHLARIVRPFTNEHPKVDLEQEVCEGPPAKVLLEEAEGADLLVVGTRGRGAIAGALLGSVSLHCVAQAPCPVVVVRKSHRTSS
jgi:nucleotide-binding universal stress UspA family protein